MQKKKVWKLWIELGSVDRFNIWAEALALCPKHAWCNSDIMQFLQCIKLYTLVGFIYPPVAPVSAQCLSECSLVRVRHIEWQIGLNSWTAIAEEETFAQDREIRSKATIANLTEIQATKNKLECAVSFTLRWHQTSLLNACLSARWCESGTSSGKLDSTAGLQSQRRKLSHKTGR